MFPEVSTGFHRFLQVSTGFHRIPEVYRGFQRFTEVYRDLQRLTEIETKLNLAGGAFGDMEKALFSVLVWTFLPKKWFAKSNPHNSFVWMQELMFV